LHPVSVFSGSNFYFPGSHRRAAALAGRSQQLCGKSSEGNQNELLLPVRLIN
jgi:hypothetical protein